jgi:hypothetical protein
MELNIEKIEAAIVQEVSDKIISDGDLWERVTKGIDGRIDKLWSSAAEAKIAAMVEQAVSAGFDHTYHKIDSLGRPKGEATTIAKELNRLIAGYWTERVDRNGKPSDSSYSTTSRAEWMMVQICGEKFADTMKQHVVNVGGALKDHFRKELDETVNRLLSEVFHVKSLGDQALGNPGRSVISPASAPVGS